MAANASNATATTSPTFQFPFRPQPPTSSSSLPPLNMAMEPVRFTSNPQQPLTRASAPVATFPQRTSPQTNAQGGPPSAGVTSPFGASFSQSSSSGSIPPFTVYNTSSNNGPAVFDLNINGGQFDFNQQNSGAPAAKQSMPPFQFTSTQSTDQAQGSPTKSKATSSVTIPKQISFENTTQKSPSFTSKESSSPTTPVSQQQYFSPEQPTQIERDDPPPTPADISLLEKRLHPTLCDPKALEIERSDPNSPLFSCRSFEELNLKPELLRAIYKMGFQTPSKIQEFTLPPLLGNPPKNIIAQSQSGTGKTAAFSLAAISRVDPKIQEPQALILSPTFELALQIGSVIEAMSEFLPYIKIAYAVRDAYISKRSNLIRNQLLTEPIVIGTPGTVEDYCYRKRVIDLQRLRMCVVDEADVMISTEGFQKMCMGIVDKIDRNRCQMMLFSATYNDEVMQFAREIISDPIVLRLKRERQTLHNIRQFFLSCRDQEQKYVAIEAIYREITVGQAMIFCRRKDTARELAVRLTQAQHSVGELTAALDMEMRASVINRFREQKFRVLISTNVMARGIDIEDVSLVINYDMPVDRKGEPEYETYLHRIGRCGRFGKLGYTFNLIGSQKDYDVMKAIELYYNHTIDEITIERLRELEPDVE